jgi:HPt (histidine-containing phosphotransfer) domain-containing protein
MEEEILFNTKLIEELGNKKSTIVILGFFLNGAAKDISDLEKSLEENDLPGLNMKAHKLKGSLGMLHANKLVEILDQLEIASGSEQNFESAQNLTNMFIEKYAVLITQMEREVASIKAGLA